MRNKHHYYYYYLTLIEGNTLFNKLWPLLDLRAELDLRLTKSLMTLPQQNEGKNDQKLLHQTNRTKNQE